MTAAEIEAELTDRGITEVRHFTTNRGLLGTLSAGELVSRRRLGQQELTELIAMNNCQRRWDTEWFDHVSLSLQRINGYLYGISSNKWWAGREDLWWCVLGFDTSILSHPDVVFCTTNNGHYSAVKRGYGVEGLRALFAPEVTVVKNRRAIPLERKAQPDNMTTSPEAEVLYPGAVSTQYLRVIYVPQPHLADSVHGWFTSTLHPEVAVVYDPEVFA